MPKQVVRLNFDAPPELARRYRRIPHGMRSELLRALLTRAMDAADKHGGLVYGAVIEGSFRLEYDDKANLKNTTS